MFNIMRLCAVSNNYVAKTKVRSRTQFKVICEKQLIQSITSLVAGIEYNWTQMFTIMRQCGRTVWLCPRLRSQFKVITLSLVTLTGI